jgi:hypothetical protein
MPAPEITAVNAVRFRAARADVRMKQALALVREAAAAPDYLGPPVESVERAAAAVAEILAEVKVWKFAALARQESRPQRTAKQAIARIYRGF